MTITSVATRRQETVAGVLTAQAKSLREIRPGRWHLDLGNGRALPVTAALEDRWLLMAVSPEGTPEPPPDTGRLVKVIEANAALPGGAKRALVADRTLELRAEVLLSDSWISEERVREACDGLRCENVIDMAHAEATEPSAVLSTLAEESGWETREHGADRIAALEVPGRSHRARVRETREGRVRVEAEVGSWEQGERPSVGRDAVAAVLLEVAGAVRLVRAGLRADGDLRTAFLEVVLPGDARGEDLAVALSALSVACRLCGAEIPALLEREDLARAYLAVRGWAS